MRSAEINQCVQINIQESPLDLVKLNAMAQTSQGDIGASVVFTGNVRTSTEQNNLVAMTLEHYPGMTEIQLKKIVDQALIRWCLSRVIVAHRVGTLKAGEPIVFIAVSGLHRKECFEAAQFIMDYLKNNATFWKKVHHKQGNTITQTWVEAKQSDVDSINRWQNETD